MQFARVVTVAQPLVFTAVALTIFVERTEITTSPSHRPFHRRPRPVVGRAAIVIMH